MRKRMRNAGKSPDEIAYITYEMYELIREQFVEQFVHITRFWAMFRSIAKFTKR